MPVPGHDELTPRRSRRGRSGELFVYVNDAVIGIPGHVDKFYRNNKGKAELTIEEIAE